MQQQPATVLHNQLTSVGIPIVGVSGNAAPFTVTYDPSATQAQIDQGNAIAAAFDGQPRIPRPLAAIYNSLNGLSNQQLVRIWTDLSAPTSQVPRKYLADVGINAGSIFVMDWASMESGATGASLNSSHQRIMSMYVQDNPYYLVKPPFDSTINIPGDQPIS